MKPLAKAGSVVAGYVAAFVIASAVVALYVAATSGPDRQTYGAMYGFGDSLLFLGVLGVAAVPATGAGLFFLRPCRTFWLVLSVAALGWALVGLAAFGVFMTARMANPSSGMAPWAAVAVLRILVAPLFTLFFLLSGLFAPHRSFRIALAVATLMEAATSGSYALQMFLSYRSH